MTSTAPTEDTPLTTHRVAVFVLLAALAVASNVASQPLFFSVSMIFGSVFAMMAIRLLGLWPGVVVAAIGASYTYVLWGHPYAIVIFTAEALFVGLMLRRNMHLPVADLLYWIFVGSPLVILFYWSQIGMSIEAAGLIAVKQPVNGMLNAVIAAVLLVLISLYRPSMLPSRIKSIGISRLIFNFTLLFTILAGTIPMAIESRNVKVSEEEFVERLMQSHADWLRSEVNQTAVLAWAASDDVTMIESPQPYLKFGILSPAGELLAHSGDLKSLSPDGSSSTVSADMQIWQPSGDMPSMLRWRSSRYVLSVPMMSDAADSPTILIEYDASPVVAKLDAKSATILAAIAILIVISVIAVEIFSRWLTSPVRELTARSERLVTAVTSEEPVSMTFPRSRVSEYDNLADGLEATSSRLAEAFAELNQMRGNLEQEIRQRTRDLRRMSLVAQQTQNGVVITDRRGVTQWVNEAFIQLTGYSSDEMIGQTPGKLLQGPDTSQETIEEIRSAVAAKESFNVEILNYTKSGDPYWVEIIANPLRDENGVIEGFIAIETDISERKRLEASKDEFISSVNHELRTPLTSISGSLSLIHGGAFGELPPKLDNAISIAKRNTERLMALVNDILDVQRVLSGKLNLERSEIEAAALLESAVQENQSYADQHEVALEIASDSNGGIIIGDEHRLMQVMTNLISNAVKFSPKGSKAIAGSESNGTMVRFSVTDQGPGISEEFRSRIFGRFAQADSSDTKEKGGTGLGLNISSSLVEEHGGRISFECPKEGGTRFFFDIPKA